MGLSSKKVISSDSLDSSQETLLQTQTMDLTKPPGLTKRIQQHQQPEALKCPRCESGKTKFCYYNNYSKTQPRYFCKACRRHWTEGGILRNVPIGGGRKNKRHKVLVPKSAAASSTTDSIAPVLINPQIPGADHLYSNQANPRQPSSEFQLQDLEFSSGNKLLNVDHVFGSLEANLCSFQSSSSGYIYNTTGNNGGMECWNWDDIDSLICADLNISPWDDPEETKP